MRCALGRERERVRISKGKQAIKRQNWPELFCVLFFCCASYCVDTNKERDHPALVKTAVPVLSPLGEKKISLLF